MSTGPATPERLQDLLALEDDQGFLDLKCPSTGVLAWPAIRNDVFRLLLGDRFYPSAPIVNLERRPSVARLVTAALRSAVHSRTHGVDRSDVLIVGTGSGLIAEDGRLLNRHTDYFAEALASNAWTLEGLAGDSWPSQPRSNLRLGFLGVERLQIAATMRLRVRSADRSLAAQLVDLVVERGRSALGWDVRVDRGAALRGVAARRLAAYRIRALVATRTLRRTAAKVVLLEDASFGTNAVFNATARSRGVHVAEFQHGMITSGHDGYNAHPRLAGSQEYGRTQPQSLLTYGDWWSRQFNSPTRPTAIGNPHRSRVLSDWRPADHRGAILVFGDGVETDRYLALCRELAANAGAHRVVFRPHPWERQRVVGLSDPRFTVDRESDLYRSLASAAAVVGEASTALYESAGLVPHVIVWDTPKSRFYLGEHPFLRLSAATDLPMLLTTPEPPATLLSELWAPEWRSRFLSCVDGLLGRGPARTD